MQPAPTWNACNHRWRHPRPGRTAWWTRQRGSRRRCRCGAADTGAGVSAAAAQQARTHRACLPSNSCMQPRGIEPTMAGIDTRPPCCSTAAINISCVVPPPPPPLPGPRPQVKRAEAAEAEARIAACQGVTVEGTRSEAEKARVEAAVAADRAHLLEVSPGRGGVGWGEIRGEGDSQGGARKRVGA